MITSIKFAHYVLWDIKMGWCVCLCVCVSQKIDVMGIGGRIIISILYVVLDYSASLMSIWLVHAPLVRRSWSKTQTKSETEGLNTLMICEWQLTVVSVPMGMV